MSHNIIAESLERVFMSLFFIVGSKLRVVPIPNIAIAHYCRFVLVW